MTDPYPAVWANDLAKTFRVPEREAGVLAAVKSLVHRRMKDVAAVKGVTFRLEPGEVVGFLGPNGAGKTTTMRILTGFMPASEGRARVAGFDVETDSLNVRRRVGYLPESVPIYREAAVRDYLRFVAEVKGVPRPGLRAHLDTVMEQVGIGAVAGRVVGRLSRGYRQRVGIAQALIGDPEVLVLDEPTVGLDPAQVVEVRELIRGLAGRRTVILSTHILPEVSQICTRVLILNRGRIVASGTAAELTGRLAQGRVFRIRVRGDGAAAAARLESLPAVARVEQDPDTGPGEAVLRVDVSDPAFPESELARALLDGGFGLSELSPVDLTLEEIFLSLVRSAPAAAPAPAGATPEPEGDR